MATVSIPARPVAAPKKPFDGYRWRWATLTPTEGLNEPPVFLGVLRVLAENEGKSPSAPEVTDGLRRVENDVRDRVSTGVRLPRSPERNLIRNSGQYWKALGLIESTRGNIRLTDFGRKVAGGDITKDEFAAVTVKTLSIPNRRIESDVGQWEAAHLEIKPLELILRILTLLRQTGGDKDAYVTPFELYSIVIPLAGTNPAIEVYVRAIMEYRSRALDLGNWPNCTPGSNDRRMAREFLLFLAHYGYLKRTDGDNETERYHLRKFFADTSTTLLELAADPIQLDQTIAAIREREATSFAQRERVMADIVSRPNQGRFRKNVLTAFQHKCLITGETVPNALVACHIMPVENNGSDTIGNGLCLRADIHGLFDAGDLRIDKEGRIQVSDVVRASPGYANLPSRITIPSFLDKSNIEWRWNYC
jgi:hypothetical protein